MCLAIPGKILDCEEIAGIRVGRVQFGGVTRQTYLDYVPEAGPGDYVMVHVGFAISKVDEDEAARTYATMQLMGLLEEELGPPAAIIPEKLPSETAPEEKLPRGPAT